MSHKPEIKFNLDLESEGGRLYRQYCEEKGIDYSITAGANFCLGYMAVKETQCCIPLTPGAPTTTGTYFAVLKPFIGDKDEMVVLHYQADKGVYYAYGMHSRPVKAEDVIGYVAREGHEDLTREEFERRESGMRWVKASEFKKEVGMPYHAKDNRFKGAGHFNGNGAFIWGDCTVTHPKDQDDLYLLDESGTAAAREEDAVAFHDWVEKYRSEYDFREQRTHTTAELYQLFKQQKEK